MSYSTNDTDYKLRTFCHIKREISKNILGDNTPPHQFFTKIYEIIRNMPQWQNYDTESVTKSSQKNYCL